MLSSGYTMRFLLGMERVTASFIQSTHLILLHHKQLVTLNSQVGYNPHTLKIVLSRGYLTAF
jgi:hypothetical protein